MEAFATVMMWLLGIMGLALLVAAAMAPLIGSVDQELAEAPVSDPRATPSVPRSGSRT